MTLIKYTEHQADKDAEDIASKVFSRNRITSRTREELAAALIQIVKRELKKCQRK